MTTERSVAVTGQWTTLKTKTAPAVGLLEYLPANAAVRSDTVQSQIIRTKKSQSR